MGPEFETIEARITPMLAQLQSECGILQRMVYKNKNQHRRSSYFQRLLKVQNWKFSYSMIWNCIAVVKFHARFFFLFHFVNMQIFRVTEWKIEWNMLVITFGFTVMQCVFICLSGFCMVLSLEGKKKFKASAIGKLGGACDIVYPSYQRR